MSDTFIDELRANVPSEVTIDAYLDAGGQGAVFLGSACGERAAVKIFRPESNLKRLQRELELLKSVACPYLARILWDGQVSIDGIDCQIVAYEFHDGGDLRRLLRSDVEAISISELVRLGLQVGEGVNALWAKRIVHRDIKPANIVRSSNGSFVLVDLGLAKHLDRSDLTMPGAAPGTTGYKSPEHAAGRRNLTVKADWFSLGITLYEVASKRHPYNRRQPVFGSPPPPPLSTFRPDLPAPLQNLIHEMLRETPAIRPLDVASRFQEFID